jgi:hypothetical protein
MKQLAAARHIPIDHRSNIPTRGIVLTLAGDCVPSPELIERIQRGHPIAVFARCVAVQNTPAKNSLVA